MQTCSSRVKKILEELSYSSATPHTHRLFAVHSSPPSRKRVREVTEKVALFLSRGRIEADPPHWSLSFSLRGGSGSPGDHFPKRKDWSMRDASRVRQTFVATISTKSSQGLLTQFELRECFDFGVCLCVRIVGCLVRNLFVLVSSDMR